MQRLCIVMSAVLGCGHMAGASPRILPAADVQPNEFLVVGIVIAADPIASLLTIRQANLLGRLHIETKSYHVKLRRSLAGIRTGDRVTAVFSTKDGMLHRLTRVRNERPARDN